MKFKKSQPTIIMECQKLVAYNEQGFVAGVELVFRLPGTAAE